LVALVGSQYSGMRSHELPCGHFIMIDMPDELTELLVAAA
jgi:hypothetical protein